MAKKESTDPFKIICDRVKRMHPMYKGKQYWEVMKTACDSVQSGKATQAILDDTEREWKSWGANTSNKEMLRLALENLKECEVAE